MTAAIIGTVLFVLLTPGLLLRIPSKGPLLHASVVHAIVFAILFYVISKLVYQYSANRESFDNMIRENLQTISMPSSVTDQLKVENRPVVTFEGVYELSNFPQDFQDAYQKYKWNICGHNIDCNTINCNTLTQTYNLLPFNTGCVYFVLSGPTEPTNEELKGKTGFDIFQNTNNYDFDKNILNGMKVISKVEPIDKIGEGLVAFYSSKQKDCKINSSLDKSNVKSNHDNNESNDDNDEDDDEYES
jgi:hypothetical protein